MTLILSMSSEKHICLTADRRVTCNGKLVEDESNKTCVLFCDDARVVFAFTGLASYRQFSTQEWLGKTLSDIGKTTHTINEILTKLETQANHAFASIPLKYRAICFVCSGFAYWNGTPAHFSCTLSNFHSINSTGILSLTMLNARPPACHDFGSTPLSNSQQDAINRALVANPKPYYIIHAGVRMIRKIANDKRSNGLIGKKCNSIIINAKPNSIVLSTYHTDKVSDTAYSSDVVSAVSSVSGGYFAGVRITAPELLSGPELRKREPCWCGSGKRFKDCHLRKFGSVYANIPGFRTPLPWRCQFSADSSMLLPAGSHFIVSSGID